MKVVEQTTQPFILKIWLNIGEKYDKDPLTVLKHLTMFGWHIKKRYLILLVMTTIILPLLVIAILQIVDNATRSVYEEVLTPKKCVRIVYKRRSNALFIITETIYGRLPTRESSPDRQMLIKGLTNSTGR